MKKLNRGWVKNAVIAFLAVMLALTFFSNTIMNLSLPEVETTRLQSGSIVDAIRERGRAEASASYSIEVEQPRRILAVLVRDGDEVQQGDRLFELEEGEDELRSQLEELRRRYQAALLDLANADFALQNETIRQLREDLQRAVNDRAALGTAPTTLAVAQARVNETTATFNTENGRLDALEAELDFVDGLDSRSARIGSYVIAFERALADFILEMGMSYDLYIEEYPDSDAPAVLAVQGAELDMQTAAAAARAVLVGEINSQAAIVRTAATARADAQNVYNRVEAIDGADERVRVAQRALNAALISLSQDQQQESTADARRRLELAAMEEDIADLEERIRLREGDTEDGRTVITARYDGVISGLTAVAGQNAEPGIPLARIEVAQLGYLAEISVDARQVQQVRPGTPVDVSGTNWFAHITGSVTGIRPDPADPSNRRIITIELLGDVTVGEELSLSVQLSSAQFDNIVPRSAIGQDAQGAHVYVLQERTSPLGTRYIAVRQSVSILAQDENRAAVSGLDWGAAVITRSSAPISDRDIVRLAQN